MTFLRRSTIHAVAVLACLQVSATLLDAQAPVKRRPRASTARPTTSAAASAADKAAAPASPAAASGPAVAVNGIAVETTTRSLQPGEVVLFRVTAPADATDVSVTAFQHTAPAYRLDDGAWRAIVGVDLDIKPGVHPVTVAVSRRSGKQSVSGELTVLPKQFRTRRLTVNPALVEPPPEALERIKRESEKTSGIYRTPQPFVVPAGYVRFIRPVAEPANSAFGTRSVFNGKAGSPHTGADFLSGTGTPIKAPSAGHVRLAEDLYFSGNTVIVDHGLGLYSMFAHLSAFKVREGDIVNEGDVVGLVGATGRVTGPHLHWSLRANGARVDPLSLLAVFGTEISADANLTPLAVH